jgi:hypothetical protein
MPATVQRIGFFLGAILFAAWVFTSETYAEMYLHSRFALFNLAGLVGFAALLGAMLWRQCHRNGKLHWGWFLALALVVVALFAVVYPLAQTKPDRDDSGQALSLATSALLHGHYPYYARTYQGDPITPMPGCLLLAAPFQALGIAGLQNLFWWAMLILFARRYFKQRSTAFAFLLAMLANAHITMNLITAADYPTNCIYLAIASALFLSSAPEPRRWPFAASCLLLGVAFSSRPTYLLVLPILLCAFLRQREGWLSALLKTAAPLAVTAAVTLPFYLYDRAGFSPLHLTHKFKFLPPEAQQPLMLALMLAAILTACTGFFLRLDLPRLYLIAAIAFGLMLGTPGLIYGVIEGFGHYSLLMMAYAETAYILLALWAFRRLEAHCAGEEDLSSSILVP